MGREAPLSEAVIGTSRQLRIAIRRSHTESIHRIVVRSGRTGALNCVVAVHLIACARFIRGACAAQSSYRKLVLRIGADILYPPLRGVLRRAATQWDEIGSSHAMRFRVADNAVEFVIDYRKGSTTRRRAAGE